jgi:hypothetical protein
MFENSNVQPLRTLSSAPEANLTHIPELDVPLFTTLRFCISKKSMPLKNKTSYVNAPVIFFPFPSMAIFLLDVVGLLLFCLNSTGDVTVRSDITFTETEPETPLFATAEAKSPQVA